MSFVTCDLCDAFPDEVSVVTAGFRNFGGTTAFCGQVVTVKCFEDNSVVKEQVGMPGRGRVLVVDGGGSLRCALLGDMLAAEASRNGWSGLVIFGAVRDVDELARIAVGIQALGCIPVKSVRQGRGDLDIPVTFGGVTFVPGHFVYADNNGIIVSSHDLLT